MRLYQASPTRAWAIVLLRVRFDLVSWVLQVLRGGASSCTLISSPQGQLSHDARVRGMASSMQLSDINVVPVQTGRVHMVFGGNISHKQTPVMVRMTTDPVMVLGGSMGWVITMASGGSAGYSYQGVPHHPQVSVSASHYCSHTIPLLFLSYLSTCSSSWYLGSGCPLPCPCCMAMVGGLRS